MKKASLFEFRHLFFAGVLLWLALQLNWMAQRQHYHEAALRLLTAPAAAFLLCFLYFIFFNGLTRIFSIPFTRFLSKANSFFPFLYLNVFLVFFPYANENILFFELLLFTVVHLYLLAALTKASLFEKLCTFLIFLILSFSLSEVSLRVYHALKPSFLFTSKSYNRFRAQPQSFHYDFKLNSGGFNDVEFIPGKKPGVRRIIGLGDSFLFGLVPYENNFFTVLENDLNASGKKVELFNMGIYGTALDDYYNLLVNEGMPLKPDIVICHLFMGNDIENYYASFSYRNDNLFHYKEWFLFKLADYAFRIKPKYKGKIIVGKTVYNENTAHLSRKDFMNIKLERYEVFDKTLDINEWYESAAEILVKMKALLNKTNASLLVVLIPDELQINTELQKEFLKTANAEYFARVIKHKPVFEFNLPQEKLKPYLKRHHIAFVDLLPAFKTQARTQKLYLPNDNHWNVEGNKLAAKALYDKLVRALE